MQFNFQLCLTIKKSRLELHARKRGGAGVPEYVTSIEIKILA
jgi:hypothetical protein